MRRGGNSIRRRHNRRGRRALTTITHADVFDHIAKISVARNALGSHAPKHWDPKVRVVND
jgi:hypothetical protein